MQHEHQRAGIVTGITAYVLWGLLTIYWKQLHHFRAFELIGWRISSAAIVMTLVVTMRRRWSTIGAVFRNRRLMARITAASVLLTVNWTAYVWAVVAGRVLETALGYFIAPLGTVAVGVIVMHERLRPAQWVAIGFATSSVAVLTVSYGAVPWLALIIAGSWIAYGVLKKQVPLAPVESLASESLLLVVPAAVLAYAMSGDPTSIPHSATTWEFVLVACAGVATVVPLLLFSHAAQRVPLTIIGPMQYIVPSMNFVIGWMVYGEDMPPSRFLGFALVWVGLAVLTADSARRAIAVRTAPTAS